MNGVLAWLLDRAHDADNRILEMLYSFVHGSLRWFLLLRESPAAMLGLVLIGFWVFVALFAPYLTSYDPNAIDYAMLEIGRAHV